MTSHQVIINSEIYQLIPYGFCACGCGGKTNFFHNKFKKFIWGHNSLKGSNNIQWKGGKYFTVAGYVQSYSPNHPRACHNYVYEHILLAEKALGKPLPPKAIVHHANGSKNYGLLVICPNQKYHALLHYRMRALKECGYATWVKCRYCKKWDKPSNIFVCKNLNSGYHKICHSKYELNRRHSKKYKQRPTST
jgi:hypothetical protein